MKRSSKLQSVKIASIALLLMAPLAALEATGGTYWVSVLTRATYLALFTITLDIFSGTTGYLNLGHTLLIGIGAYSASYMSSKMGLDPLLAGLVAAIITPVTGLILFLPSLRVRGVYFAVLTLLTPIIFIYLLSSYPLSLYFGGEGGLYVKHHLSRLMGVAGLKGPIARSLLDYYFAALLMLGIAVIFTRIANRTRIGLFMRLIGQDEELARFSGVNVNRIKALSFALSACIAGLAGAYYAHYSRVVTVQIFAPDYLLIPILTVWVIGGPGTIIGPIAASYLIVALEEALRPVMGDYRVMVYMALLLALVILRPTGLLFWLIGRIEKRLEGG